MRLVIALVLLISAMRCGRADEPNPLRRHGEMLAEDMCCIWNSAKRGAGGVEGCGESWRKP